MHAAGDVRIEDVPDPTLVEPTDAIVRVTRACMCRQRPVAVRADATERDRPVDDHKAIGVVAEIGAGSAAYIAELLPDSLEGRIEPGRVFDRTVELDGVSRRLPGEADRESIKVMVRP